MTTAMIQTASRKPTGFSPWVVHSEEYFYEDDEASDGCEMIG